MKKQLDPTHILVSSVYLFLHNSFSLSSISFWLLAFFSFPFLSLIFSLFPLCAFYVRVIPWSSERLARFQEYDSHYHFGLSSLFPLSLAAVSFSSLKYFSWIAWTLQFFEYIKQIAYSEDLWECGYKGWYNHKADDSDSAHSSCCCLLHLAFINTLFFVLKDFYRLLNHHLHLPYIY